ncbi:unnamed protein product [Cladocopium goreaui]|uniref:Reverse transcriptase domain-containing protein n=1 Tax=Cladocopium goreaui TaxID=2562237 RepID=A0A9P1DW27_9DINO|nr:unnamed protein product [Cladocopium goreaui]
MEAWSEKMMQARLEEPPANYVKTSMKQLESADRKLFLLISEKTREGIKCNAQGRPIDAVFKQCMESSEVLSLLQPRPGGSGSTTRPSEGPAAGEPPAKRIKGGGKARGKSFSKFQGTTDSFVRIPKELLSLGADSDSPVNSNFPTVSEQSAPDPPQGQSRDRSEVFAGLMDSLQVPKGTSVPFFVELCAGSAKLSDAVKQHGYHIIAVDHDKNRHAPRCKIIQLDLSHEHAWDMLDFLLERVTISGVHIAPPCGTCSKARGIPMKDGTNHREFAALELYCDGQHEHLPWGIAEDGAFSTSHEAEYPKALCVKYAEIFHELCRTRGIVPAQQASDEVQKLAPNQQPKGRKLPQLIPEFAFTKTMQADKLPQLWHPYDELKNLPGDLIRVLFQHLSQAPDIVTRSRIKILSEWASRAKALNALEEQLKLDMDADVAKIMAPKRILLMRSIAMDMSWPDMGLFDEFTEGVEPNFKASCIDLKSAYKQFPLHEENHKDAVVTLWNPPKRRVDCFIMKVLPFGATASVHHFLRISAFLQAIGRFMGLIWSAFFDDFVVLSHAMHEASTMTSALTLLDLLGFQYSKDKLQPFSDKTEMLGVELNLVDGKNGTVEVRNKASRANELCDVLDRILQSKKVVVKELPSTLGKLQFAEGQLWGRTGRLALSELRRHEKSGCTEALLDQRSIDAAHMLFEKMKNGKPRTIRITPRSKPFLLFTDGALEYESSGKPTAGIGAVLLCPDGRQLVFGTKVEDETLKRWQVDGKSHVVGLVELYAAITAFNTWADILQDQRLICFTDSWPVLDALVKGNSPVDEWRDSPVDEWRDLLLIFENLDERINSMLWMARVASKSNPADAPSRFSFMFRI